MAPICLLQEGKDKQFLLAKIADLTGESKKKAPKLTTVNENKKHIEVTIYLEICINIYICTT